VRPGRRLPPDSLEAARAKREYAAVPSGKRSMRALVWQRSARREQGENAARTGTVRLATFPVWSAGYDGPNCCRRQDERRQEERRREVARGSTGRRPGITQVPH
jgi:hypothetical protein